MDLAYQLITQIYPGFAAWPSWLVVALCALIPAGAFMVAMSMAPLFYVYAERKVSAFMQDRLGPMRVGPYGVLQTLADTIKLLMKEAIFPRDVDRALFLFGPCLVQTGAFMALAVLPVSSRLFVADLNIALLYVVAVSSLSTVGIIMSAWASNNKYSLLGGMRSAAQIVSYEIPEVIVMLTVVLIAGSLSLQDIVRAQYGGLTNWLVFRYFPIMPIAFLIFFVAGTAECNRTPFDIPEAESELVAGFHTEYSGFFFAMFFLSEYTEMFVISAVASSLFLGGWMTPFPNNYLQSIGGVGLGPFWLVSKVLLLIFVMMWLRWTLPRLRVDQLMYMAWKVLLPTALALVVIVATLLTFESTANGFDLDRYIAWPVTLLVLGWLAYVMIGARLWNARRARELSA
ncbi:MAG: NADH-quinone oxidoreductase subunit NuoH [Vicinamibacteria bacterium]|nr:NADH-quinone oxidoreductase subunit NuoH [Vicinamibacteria bacterium]